MKDLQEAKFHPVMLGTDIGAYAILRSFHDLTGKKGTAVTHTVLGPLQNSRILDVKITGGNPDLEDYEVPPLIEGLLKVGPELQQEHPGEALLLMANIDSNIWDIVKYKDELSKFYTFAFPSLEIIKKTNDKAVFPQLAKSFQMNVPPTLEINLDQGVDSIIESVATFDHPFPWILKSALGYGYERLHWEGKFKVYTIESLEDLRRVLTMIDEHTRDHPRARRFVLQPRVDGNDTYNLSITAYVDSSGKVTMLGSAHVLLEDHAPGALGNPAAMITEPYPELYQQAIRFLEGLGWHGFANFDIKVDRASGVPYFFEVNPRIGRNCYYNTLSGLNPMEFLVRDMILGEQVPLRSLPHQALYSVLPKHLLLRYVDRVQGAKVRGLYRHGRAGNPIINPKERGLCLRSLRREFYVQMSRMKHWLKYRRNYPVAKLAEQGLESFDSAPLVGKFPVK